MRFVFIYLNVGIKFIEVANAYFSSLLFHYTCCTRNGDGAVTGYLDLLKCFLFVQAVKELKVAIKFVLSKILAFFEFFMLFL